MILFIDINNMTVKLWACSLDKSLREGLFIFGYSSNITSMLPCCQLDQLNDHGGQVDAYAVQPARCYQHVGSSQLPLRH